VDQHGDLGGRIYSAFGKLVTPPGGLVAAKIDIPFGWQGKRLISTNLYDSRARMWSADLGAFLQPDEYVFLSNSGTLWSWPGQNPFRHRDPSGRQDFSDWISAQGWIDDAAPALAAAGAESQVPGLAQVGEAALLAINAIDALSSLESQRQSAAAIAKATSNDEKECKNEHSKEPPELPTLDATGKVHGQLPDAKDLDRYAPEDLEQLSEELQKSVQERIRKANEMGSDKSHGERQADEQQLIRQIEKNLQDRQ